ncbi:hypothetical protein AP1_0457 [Aeromonas phage AP1]|nr:hypothetical protein AP1_0457 [Aeromonas phage AP1]
MQKFANMAAVAAAGANLVQQVTSVGMAHDGIDNIPKEGTWLLDKGERVVDRRTNADLKDFLNNNSGSAGSNAIYLTQYFQITGSGDALYISAQGGANVPRDCQTVRVARSPSDDVNEYEEEVERVVGIYAPHLGARHIHITRTTDWRIVPKVPVVEPLTLKSGIAAPRSPVNNCGKLCSQGKI